MNQFIISIMCNEYDVSSTYPQLLLYPLCLVPESSTVSIFSVWGGGVVVEGSGRLHHSSELNKPGVVLSTKKPENAIDLACVTPSTLHYQPAPAQVIEKNN
jgi:hypothetical protein